MPETPIEDKPTDFEEHKSDHELNRFLIDQKAEAITTPVISGTSGAPTSTPTKIGDVYVDTSTGNIYVSVGTGGAYNWGYVGQGGLSSFTKDTIANCVGWYDANDASTITLMGANVTAWNDKSDRLGNLLTTPATKPVLTTNVQNGLSGIYFGGATYISQTGLANKVSTSYSVYTAILPTSWAAGTYQAVIAAANATPTALFQLYKNTGNTNNYVYSYNVANTATSGITNNNPFVVGIRVNAANSKIDINGTSTGIVLGTTGMIASYLLFGGWGVTYPYTGYMFETFLFDRLLTDSEHSVIMSYLNNKYAIY